MVRPLEPWPLPPGFGTEAYFERCIREYDPWAEIEFDNVNHLIRITPSRPLYREAIIDEAKMQRPVGVLCSVMKLVDDFECTQYTAKELGIETSSIQPRPWWSKVLGLVWRY